MDNLVATPLSKDAIRQRAEQLRLILELKDDEAFPAIDFVEKILPILDPSFTFLIVEDGELDGAYATTYPKTREIIIENQVYEGIYNGHEVGIHMFTIAHELGHYFLHTTDTIRLNRNKHRERTPAYMDPEWQANEFAANLLIPESAIKNGVTAAELAKQYKVSKQMASIRIQRVLKS